MAIGLSYLAAKSAEFAATLDWIDGQLTSLPTLASDHTYLEKSLRQRISEARARISKLRTVLQLNVPSLVPRGVSIVNELHLDIILLSWYYLPALKKETVAEAEIGRLATKTARRCGLNDIQEILVNLSGGHAMVSAMVGSPLMFAPPHQRHTLIDLTAIYHEFGHVVFNAQPPLRDGLARACTEYYRTLERGGGFMTPAERDERRKQIRQARAYWTMRRLAEMFCDIFATFTAGLAYCFVCVDAGIRSKGDPYGINLTDEHPPIAARVFLCKSALTPSQLGSEVGRKVLTLWEEHVRSSVSSSEFRLWCGDNLLATMVNETVARLTGVFRKYTGTGHHPQMAPAPDINLEDLLNESVYVLLHDPDAYIAWERPYVNALFQ